jgi:proline iminopeptidase
MEDHFNMKPLYPPLKNGTDYELKVDKIHTLYVEESGNPNGIPVLFVHGGPGIGTTPDDRRFFDPDRYRIILFDQRGCGRSTPHASIENNSLDHTLSDMEKIRTHLKIERWVLFGGSWGSTVSLCYAQANPSRVMGMILRGIFLAREKDLYWLYQTGANRIFPDHWEHFVSLIPEEERDDLVRAYYKRVTGEDELAKMNAAKHWAQWEGECATLDPSKSLCEKITQPHVALSMSRIATHYFMNHCFLEPNQILQNAYKLEGIPGIIVHGRYDMICPFDNARALHLSWPGSQLQVIREAGHVASEPGITDALIQATEELARRF